MNGPLVAATSAGCALGSHGVVFGDQLGRDFDGGRHTVDLA